MTDFRKKPGAENKTITEKLGPQLTRALMTAPGKSVPDSINTYQRRTGITIHNPLADQCYCIECVKQRERDEFSADDVPGHMNDGMY